MASNWYPKAKESLLKGDLDLDGVIRAVLIDTGVYTYSAAHANYSDLSGVVGTESAAFASKTMTNGVFDAADITFTAPTGATAEALVIFLDTGTASTDKLILYIDSAAAGLPVVPDGTDRTVTWNASGIAAL